MAFDLASTLSAAQGIGITMLFASFGLMILGGIWWLGLQRRYNINVIVMDYDPKTKREVPFMDKGGIFIDSRSGNKRFNLKRCQAGLTCDNVPTIPIDGKPWVWISRFSSTDYRFMRISFDEAAQDYKVTIDEEDINSSVQHYDVAVAALRKKSVWATLLPLIVIFIAVFFTFIIAITLIQKIGDVTKISDNNKAMTEAQLETSKNILIALDKMQSNQGNAPTKNGETVVVS